MAAVIKRELGIEPKLIRGAGGVFDVRVDKQLVYSKHQSGRFPEHQEIIDTLGRLIA